MEPNTTHLFVKGKLNQQTTAESDQMIWAAGWMSNVEPLLTLYTSTNLAWGKWNGAMNKRTHSLFIPSRYKLSATIRATKFFPVPDQPWKDRVSGLLDSGFLMNPWMAFRTTDWTRCCPWSFTCRSFSNPEICIDKRNLFQYMSRHFQDFCLNFLIFLGFPQL